MTTTAATDAAAATSGLGVPFTIASRAQARFANSQTVNNANAGSFQIVQLPATGWVRAITLEFSASSAFASGGSMGGGDAPFSLINSITITDATGQPIYQPISGYNLYLLNKYAPSGWLLGQTPWCDPTLGVDYDHSSTATQGQARFRLYLTFEQDSRTGYGSIPNLDSNASLQLKVDHAAFTAAFNGTTPGVSSLAMRVTQHYWAPTPSTMGGQPVAAAPPGAGDYLETRYETQTVSAASENLVTLTNRGGLVKDIIVVSRNGATRTALPETAQVGILLDNQPIYEGISFAEFSDQIRRVYGYVGPTRLSGNNPFTQGLVSGLDRGVLPIPFQALSAYRDAWLNTRVGSLLQLKITPGAGATSLEVMTQLAQVKDAGAFYSRGA